MITIKTMYELYNTTLNLEIDVIEKEISKIQVIRHRIKTYFSQLPDIDKDFLKELFLGTVVPSDDTSTNNIIFFNKQLTVYNEVTVIYKKKRKEIDTLRAKKIKKSIYYYIIVRFNTLLVEELIYNNYKFITKFIGNFAVIKNMNKKKIVDWVQSNINKKAILDKGQKLYYKKEAEEAKTKGEEYTGVEWLTYLDEEVGLFFNWQLLNYHFIRIPNMNNFTFEPYKGDTSPVKMLMEHKRDLGQDYIINNFNT